MRPTDLAALDAIWPLPLDELPRQWVLSVDRDDVPDAWYLGELAGWHLAAHPDAHVCELRADDGTAIGWVIEPLAYLRADEGWVPDDELVLSVSADASAADIERALYGRGDDGRSSGDGLEGMWTAIVFAGSPEVPVRRVYLGAIHSIVYDPDRRIVATSHNLLPEVRRDVEISRAFDALANNSYVTFGLTPFVGLDRLLPNHFLDLDDFSPVRHWPRGAIDPLTHGGDGAAAMVEHSQRLVRALLDRYRHFRVFLSAGRDSRAVLSLLRPLLDDVDVVLATTVGIDQGSRVDLQGARRLATVAGLPLEVSRREPHEPDEEAVRRAFVRIGESKGGPILSAPGVTDVRARHTDGRFVLSGMAGEVGRASFWKDGPPLDDPTPEMLVRRTSSPPIEPVLAAAATWRDSVPRSLGPADVLDLLYVEQRMGCWESSTRYLFPGRPLVTSPMAAAYNIETMLRLPVPYRAAGLVQEDMVRYSWPELLTVPFNQPRGFLAVEQHARRLLGPVRTWVRSNVSR
jgi:hypothetical protein